MVYVKDQPFPQCAHPVSIPRKSSRPVDLEPLRLIIFNIQWSQIHFLQVTGRHRHEGPAANTEAKSSRRKQAGAPGFLNLQFPHLYFGPLIEEPKLLGKRP